MTFPIGRGLSFRSLLFTKEDQIAYFQVLSAVLLCGNIKFVDVQAMGTDK